jgi:catechol 2,3-dioxygenase-like lactoylglutathione lyase family enzyme
MLEHIGITINEENDIQTFYKDLLRLKEVKRVDLDEDFSERLFGIRNTASITLLSGDDFLIEVFLTDEKQSQAYSHICISVHSRSDTIKKARSMGFSVNHIERDSKDDLWFLRDNSGNIFEVREASKCE